MSDQDHGLRLQKYLAECGVASRRKSEELIKAGSVQVNGKTVTQLGTRVVPGRDRVTVDGKEVRVETKGALLLHKPRGVLCSRTDPRDRPTVSALVGDRYRTYFPVGRLDWDSTGLVILTNDGDLANRLTHPKYLQRRVYEARVQGVLTKRARERLLKGVELEDGVAKALKVETIKIQRETSWVRVALVEGRKHIVKRLFDAVEHPVQKLKRISHGPVNLGRLRVGEHLVLSAEEYRRLRSKLFDEPKKARKTGKSRSK